MQRRRRLGDGVCNGKGLEVSVVFEYGGVQSPVFDEVEVQRRYLVKYL